MIIWEKWPIHGKITASVFQDLAPSPQPSPKGRGSRLSPLSSWERGGGEGDLVVAPKS